MRKEFYSARLAGNDRAEIDGFRRIFSTTTTKTIATTICDEEMANEN